MNWVDACLVVLLGLFVVLGYRKGFVLQILHIAAIAGALVVAALGAPALARIELFDDLRARNADAPDALAYLGILLVAAVVLIVTANRIAKRLPDRDESSSYDHALGGVLGGVKGVLILGALCIALLAWSGAGKLELLQRSAIAPRMAEGCRALVLLVPARTRANIRRFTLQARTRLEDATTPVGTEHANPPPAARGDEGR